MARWTRLAVVAWGLLTGSAAVVCGADSPAGLAADVPEDTALFVEIPALEATWTAWEGAELQQRVQSSRLAAVWLQSRFVERWQALDRHAAARTGQPLTQHLRQLFADGVAVAVVLRGPEPVGMLVSRARSAEALSASLKAWDQLEPPLRTEPRAEMAGQYFARVLRKGGQEQTVYYAVSGPRFVLSDQEALVRECVGRWQSAAADRRRSLADQPEFQELLTNDVPAARFFVAPQRWQPLLNRLSDGTPAAELILAGVKTLRGVAGEVRFNAGVIATLTVALEPAALSAGWNDFQQSADRWPTSLTEIPAEAFLALGGRWNVRPMTDSLEPLLSEQDRREWQRGTRVLRTLLLDVPPWTEALPALLSDWGGYVVLRPESDQQPPRSHPFVGVWFARWPGSDAAGSLRTGGENALSFGINALAAALAAQEDRPPVLLQQVRTADGTEWRLSGRAWGELAVRQTEQSLQVATSVAELQRRQSALRAEGDSPLVSTARRHFPEAAGFLWLNAKPLRQAGGLMALQLSTGGQVNPPVAALGELTQVFDELFAAVTVQPARLELRLGGLLSEQR